MIELLDWDSNFFGYKIGKLTYSNQHKSLPSDEEFKKFDLVYIFSTSRLNDKYNLVDVKVTFKKNTASKNVDDKIYFFDKTLHSYTELLELAYLSGHDSRFLKDSFFSEKDFKNLYKTWIDKSIINQKTKILVYINNNTICGFVSFKVEKIKSNIELIAVSPIARGKGIGKKLLDAVEAMLKEDTLLTVPTQETNLKACNFYLKNGFKIISKHFIYHYAANPL